MGKPRDGVRLAAACTVLNEVLAAHAVLAHVVQQAGDHDKLVEAGENLLGAFLAAVGVGLFDHLRVVLNDIGKAFLAQDIFPQVGGFQAIGIDGIARALVAALVEGQEPRTLAGKLGAELDIAVVHGKVDHAALELEEQFLGVAVGLVLLDGIKDVLLGELVFQLAGEHGQTVDEHAQVEGEARLVNRILELAGHAENILREARLGGLVAFGGKLEEGVEAGRAVLEALAEHIHHATACYFALEPVQELGLAQLAFHACLGPFLRLSLAEEAEKPHFIEGILAGVVRITALLVAVGRNQMLNDERLKTGFTGIGRHGDLTYLLNEMSRLRFDKGGKLCLLVSNNPVCNIKNGIFQPQISKGIFSVIGLAIHLNTFILAK